MRPFFTAGGFLRRTVRGVRTVLIHWPHDFPPVRWDRLILRRLIGRGLAVPRTTGHRPRGPHDRPLLPRRTTATRLGR
jgi:hypothetical protein